MANLELDHNQAHYQIRSYQPGQLRVNTLCYTKSLIITADHLIENWRPQSLQELVNTDWEPLLALKPGIVLLGTGSQLVFPPAALYSELIHAGIGVEIMDTGAACRTYNVLSSENRPVAAALLIL